MTPSQNT